MASTVRIDIVADSRKARRELDRFGGETSKFRGRVSRGMKGATKAVGVLGAAVAGLGAINVVGGLVTLGDELALMNRRAGVVFGDLEGNIRSWAGEWARALGEGQTQLVGLATNVADLLKPMGFTVEEASRLSMAAVELAGQLDIWSTETQSTAEATEILQAALLGEREAIKRLGISINKEMIDSLVKAKREQGEWQDLTDRQAESLATLELATQQSADAIAFFEGTEADAIKTTNELRSRWEDLKANLAERVNTWLEGTFYPWLQDTFLPWLDNTFLPWWTDDFAPTVASAWSGLTDGISSAWRWLSQDLWPWLVKAEDFMDRNLGPAADGVRDAMLFLLGVNPVNSALWSGLQSLWGVLRSIGNAARSVWDRLGDIVSNPFRSGGGGLWPFADGGIVTRPTAALIGEAGPEAVIPLSRMGSMGGGATYNISVQAGVGDPAEIGAQVVAAIEAYERRNTADWRTA